MNEPRPEFSRLAQELIADFRGVPDETPDRMKKRPTQGIAGLVDSILVKHSLGKDSIEDTIRRHWSEMVGPANAHYSHAGDIDPKGRLRVLASHSVVRNELFHHRAEIVEKIRKLPGCDGIRELRIVAG